MNDSAHISKFLRAHNWLSSKEIFTPQFINLLILLIHTLEPRIKNTDLEIDSNTKTLTINLKVPFFYRWKYNSFLKYVVFFVEPLKVDLLQKNMLELFPKWKLLITLR